MSALKTLAAATISAAMMATANAAPVAQTETLKVEVTESQIGKQLSAKAESFYLS